MRLAHTGDIHACGKHLKWVRRALDHFVETAIAENCDAAVLAGDVLDHAVGTHDPAFHLVASAVRRLQDAMSTVVMYGTSTHDHPGSLDALRVIGGQVTVVDRPTWVNLPEGTLFCVPGLNKAIPEIADLGAAVWMRRTLEAAGEHARDKLVPREVPYALASHGTVTGSLTESKHALISPDHEFSLETLALSEADAILLNHIHLRQDWRVRTPSGKQQVVAYSGSLARLVHGHMDPVGFLIWDIEPGNASFRFVESPSRQLIDIEFPGPPDMAELRRIAQDAGPDDAVRLHYQIDKEYAGSVDKRAIHELFAGCEQLKIEACVNHVQRVRAEGIATATTLHDKLKHWAKTTESMRQFDGLADRLTMLQTTNDDEIMKRLQ